MDGALFIHKSAGVTSFDVIRRLQKMLPYRNEVKLGHGGTLDPFATGLLIVLVGRGVKLAQYFLHSKKAYEGRIQFGLTTIPGDPTAPVSERSDVFPTSLEEIQSKATEFTQDSYWQTPPMHSAKKLNGKPLYELARQGIEVEREPKLCQIHHYEILSYSSPFSDFRVQCSSGTYIRTLTQDLAKKLGTVGLLETLHRTGSGRFHINHSQSLEDIQAEVEKGRRWNELDCWVPFDQLLDSYPRIDITSEEYQALCHGKQEILKQILGRAPEVSDLEKYWVFYHSNALAAIARKDRGTWGLERVFI